jgi:hypothetical protein
MGTRFTSLVKSGSDLDAGASGWPALWQCGASGNTTAHPAPITKLDVETRRSVTHTVTQQKIQDWLDAGPRSPREFVLEERVKRCLRYEATAPRFQCSDTRSASTKGVRGDRWELFRKPSRNTHFDHPRQR